MPKLTNSLPKYRKKSERGRAYAVVMLDGKAHYLGDFGSDASRREYDRLTGEWLANGRRLPVEQSHDITVVELIALYWRFAKTYYVKNGKATDEQACIKAALRHVKQLYGTSLARDFGPLALESVRDKMIECGNSRGYINKSINRVKRMFKWGVSKQLILIECYQSLLTVEGLRKGKCNVRETEPVLPVDIEIVESTIKFCRPVIADMIRLQVLTGCRPGEIFSMRPREIDRSQDVWRYVPGSHKTEHQNRQRVILIGPKAQKILAPYLLRDVDSHCFVNAHENPFKRWIYAEAINRACDKAFPAPEGTVGEALKAWRKKNRWAPNRLRHTRATDIRKTHGLEAAQVVLGHSRADITQVYAERDEAKAAAVMRDVG